MPDEPNSLTETDTTVTETPKVDDYGNVANAAAKSHITRFSEKILPGLIATAMKPILDELQALKAPKTEEDPKAKSKGSPELAAVMAQLEDMKGRFAAEQTARANAEKLGSAARVWGTVIRCSSWACYQEHG